MLGLTVALLLGLIMGVDGQCATCSGPYDTAVGATPTPSAAEKCTLLNTYLVCLQNNLNTAGCTFVKAIADVINPAAGACTLDASCTCLSTLFGTDPVDAATTCNLAKAEMGCLLGQTANACGLTTPISNMVASTNTYISTTLTGCTVTPTCQCQINYAANNITSLTNCTTATTLNTCYGAVTTSTEVGCSGTCPQSILYQASTTFRTAACAGASDVRVASLLLFLPVILLRLVHSDE